MSQRYQVLVLVLSCALSFGHTVYADEGDLSGDEMNEVFDDVNGSSLGDSGGGADLENDTRTAAIPASKESFSDSLPEGFERREVVDDDEDAASEINNVVGDSLTESGSFQSYTPEPEVTADRFIHGDSGNSFNSSEDPGSYNYEKPKKKKVSKKKPSKKKSIAKKSKKSKKVAKAKSSKSKSKSRKVASSKKSKNKRYR